MRTSSLNSANNVFRLVILTATAALLSSGAAHAADEFERAELRLEQNLLDMDVAVRLGVQYGAAAAAVEPANQVKQDGIFVRHNVDADTNGFQAEVINSNLRKKRQPAESLEFR
jgi:hypothetical protein